MYCKNKKCIHTFLYSALTVPCISQIIYVCICVSLSIQVITHPNYNPRANWNNDVALIKLSSPARYTSTVSPVCLASSKLSLPSGTRCVTTGWGKMTSTCEWTHTQST